MPEPYIILHSPEFNTPVKVKEEQVQQKRGLIKKKEDKRGIKQLLFFKII